VDIGRLPHVTRGLRRSLPRDAPKAVAETIWLVGQVPQGIVALCALAIGNYCRIADRFAGLLASRRRFADDAVVG